MLTSSPCPPPRSTRGRTRPHSHPHTTSDARGRPHRGREHPITIVGERHARHGAARARPRLESCHARPLMAADLRPLEKGSHTSLVGALVFQRSTFFSFIHGNSNTERRWYGVKVHLKSFYTSRLIPESAKYFTSTWARNLSKYPSSTGMADL